MRHQACIVFVFAATIFDAATIMAQSTAGFEVAAIKLCKSDGGKSGKSGAGGGRNGANSSPDRLSLNCQTVRNFIRSAYVLEGRFDPAAQVPIEGGAAWINSDRYQIVAKADGTPGQEAMSGPMLRALLEDRFKMKVHRETREVPVYALTVAKGGPKLQPFQEGSCAVLDLSEGRPAFDPGERPPLYCGISLTKRAGLNVTWDMRGGSLEDLSKALGSDLDRIVMDKAGIRGRFDFHLEFAPDDATPGLKTWLAAAPTSSDPSGGPSIFTAIQQQLGLKLESARGPREFLVIDNVEKPSEN